MASGAWRRAATRTRTLRSLLRDTARALQDVEDILPVDPDIPLVVQELSFESARPTAFVILGSSPSARARLVNCLVGKKLLPKTLPRGCKWLRIQYGATTQVQLTVSNSEFELVENLECHQGPWDTLPLQDLLRQENADLGTMLEVELNNSFLKEGLRIIVPPDIDSDPGHADYNTLKQQYANLYHKRQSVLKSYTPIYLYAMDKYRRDVFSDHVASKMTASKEEDFWSTFNLYYMTRVGNGEVQEKLQERVEDVWGIGDSVFDVENFLDLHQIKEMDAHAQVFFVLFSDSRAEEKRRDPLSDATESSESALYCSEELPESDRGHQELGQTSSCPQHTINRRLQEEQIVYMNELMDHWEIISPPLAKHQAKSQWAVVDDAEVLRPGKEEPRRRSDERSLRSRGALLAATLRFAADGAQAGLLRHCARLGQIHVKLLQQFILSSFEMARELQVVPLRIQYVARQERQLYETLNEKFSEGDKKQELLAIMQEVLDEMRSEINNMDWSVDDLPCHQDKRYAISNSIFYSSRSSPSVSIRMSGRTVRTTSPEMDDEDVEDVEEAVSYDSYNFEDYEIIDSNDDSVCLSDMFGSMRSKPESPGPIPIETGPELRSLSQAWAGSACTSTNVSSKQASLDVQRTVLSKLSRKISLKIVKFLDCLKDSYFGTLERCLQSLECCCRQELGGRPASAAMRQLLAVARQVDLTPCASFSALRGLIDSFRRLFYRLRLAGGEEEDACCVLSPAWRRRAALHAAHQLTPQRLARLISAQILERLSVAHERYQSALATLEAALANRLHHTEDVKLAIRKKYAPSFARLCLESTSMCDLLMYGTPELGREIGRGQYGVVYAVRGAWAGRAPACAKSVLPADERHYRDLAMEFFYTRSIPAHPRIVRLLGSLVQRGSGAAPGVLLLSPRYGRDLHAAVRAGLAYALRLRVAVDIVEGIRYLHSLGLVHRDVKLKNVLLDGGGRAALADLGFCAAAGLMSGSVVGTPVHMAPELLAGRYCAAVDVYAFGVLFWYLCAGNIKLPAAFETFQNKEQLWSKVKRGLRPERLPSFTDECWHIMESCWASEPSQRALLGDVQPRLESLLQQALKDDQGPVAYELSHCHSDDSLEMTGLYRDPKENIG